MSHEFIFSPGLWLGEGKIIFSESPEQLHFHCRWSIAQEKEGAITGFQEIEVEGLPDKMQNIFLFSQITPKGFEISLDNQILGQIQGKGVLDPLVIAWEFRQQDQHNFEGFEVYELQQNGSYNMRAEYASTDQLRTTISGRIWKRTPPT
jgi:hypothetical protein